MHDEPVAGPLVGARLARGALLLVVVEHVEQLGIGEVARLGDLHDLDDLVDFVDLYDLDHVDGLIGVADLGDLVHGIHCVLVALVVGWFGEHCSHQVAQSKRNSTNLDDA